LLPFSQVFSSVRWRWQKEGIKLGVLARKKSFKNLVVGSGQYKLNSYLIFLLTPTSWYYAIFCENIEKVFIHCSMFLPLPNKRKIHYKASVFKVWKRLSCDDGGGGDCGSRGGRCCCCWSVCILWSCECNCIVRSE